MHQSGASSVLGHTSRADATLSSRGETANRLVLSTTAVALIAAPKPLLRGVSHQLGFFVALAASVVLVLRAPSGAPAWAAGVFGVTLVNLFGTSALYHRVAWTDPEIPTVWLAVHFR